MLRCIAIDDEPLALELLEDNISKVPFLQLVAKCDNAMEAMKVMQQQTVDLIFLDIQMPGLTGLQFIQSMTEKPLIILITAYEKYALEGFNMNVIDYLVKPVSLERFILACNRAHEMHELKLLKTQSRNIPANDFMFVNVDYSQVKVIFSDISWIEGLRDYLKIHLRSAGKPLLVRASLKSIESELPAGKFIRIHKSYILSLDSITAIRKNSVFIKESEFPVGETYREEVDKLVRGTL